MIEPDDIAAARSRIAAHIRTTPVIEIETGTFSDAPVVLKLEFLQHTGSFKPRGAFNNLLIRHVPGAGVTAASGGNHGAAVAFAARRLGHAARIFVPIIASPVKIERIKGYGADIEVAGDAYADALAGAVAFERESGAISLHAYDATETVAGQGTLAAELEEQVRNLDTVLVAVGGGGLVGGVAAWFASRVRIVAVEPETAPTLHSALAAGQPVDVQVSGVAADSLGARRIGEIAFEIACRHVDRALTVSDDAIRDAQRRLWHQTRLIAEPGGATALAALTSGAYRPAPGERVAVIICGGNADPSMLA